MDFELSEYHLMIARTAREFARAELAKDAIERDRNQEFPFEAVKKMGELGFMGVMIPEQWGGAGMDAISYVIILDEIARVDPSASVILSVNNSLAAHAINKFGSTRQKRKFLIPLASGGSLGAFSLSEPQAGSDASNLLTFAELKGDYYLVNGTKNFVTSGGTADIVILFAVTERGKGHNGISAFVVERGTEGFRTGKKENKLGIRSSDTCELIFENCKIPVENLLGREGDGFKIAMDCLDGGRVGIAAQALGIARTCLERSIEYSKTRKQFGKFISEFEAIQFKLAEMATDLEAARLLTFRAASLMDRKKSFTKEASMAKLMASEVAMRVSKEAVQIFGGYGYMTEYEIERFMRDAKITQIYEGTTEIQKIVIARHLL